MRCSPFVRPMLLNGVRRVAVEPSLGDVEPRAYRFLPDFAKNNELIVINPSVPTGKDYCPRPGSVLATLAK